jgi:serine/threonine protein kinase
MIFQLLYGRTPFQDATSYPDLFDRICKADFKFLPVDPRPSALAEDFLRQVLTVDPTKRPTAEQALQHPWLVSEPQGLAARGRVRISVQQTLSGSGIPKIPTPPIFEYRDEAMEE